MTGLSLSDRGPSCSVVGSPPVGGSVPHRAGVVSTASCDRAVIPEAKVDGEAFETKTDTALASVRLGSAEEVIFLVEVWFGSSGSREWEENVVSIRDLES